jgi:hypothetical protein
VYAAEP